MSDDPDHVHLWTHIRPNPGSPIAPYWRCLGCALVSHTDPSRRDMTPTPGERDPGTSLFFHQNRAARHLALDADISEDHARGLLCLLKELLGLGYTYENIVDRLCGEFSGSTYRANREFNHRVRKGS